MCACACDEFVLYYYYWNCLSVILSTPGRERMSTVTNHFHEELSSVVVIVYG